MRVLEVRRHSFTKKGERRGKGSHLAQDGIAAARDLGAEIGPFDQVYTSTLPRTLETALAMGFAVDEELAVLGEIPDAVFREIGHHERWSWDEPFVAFRRFVDAGGATARLAEALKQTWTRIVEGLPESGRALVVSHGRIMECGLVASLPSGPLASWGPPFSHLEGVRMRYDRGGFRDAEILRSEIGRLQRARYAN
ncbi:MAG: phosphoglycerate mutase family protein [Myxococcota bacterium]